ncbi:MAG: mannosyltransferase [Rubritalea sp.]|jgi:mannosyltransferase
MLTFRQFTKLCKSTHPDGEPRIFHARRNDEMIQSLIAKKLFGAKIKIVFTSTAQRHHSRFTRWLMSKWTPSLTPALRRTPT